MSASDFSASLVTALSASLPDVTFEPGRPPDTLPPSSVGVGFVWVEKIEEDSSNQQIAEVSAGVRIYPIQAEQFDGTVPVDPTPLYDAAALVQSMAQANWQSATNIWFFNVPSIAFDHDSQCIEAEIVGTTWNAAAIPMA